MSRPLFEEKGFRARYPHPFLAPAISAMGRTVATAIEYAARLEQFRAKCKLVGADPEPMIESARRRASKSTARADPFWHFLDDEWRAWHEREAGR